MRKRMELAGIIVYAAAGLLVGGVVGGTLMMKTQNRPETDTQDPPAADALRAEPVSETTAPPVYHATTATFTESTTTTTTVITTTTEPAPPPLEAQTVASLLAPAKDLLSMKYHYKDSDVYEDYSEFWGRRLPFTTESVEYTYEGEITVGIVLADAQISVNNFTKQITVTLPDPTVLANELDEDSIDFQSVQNPIFGGSSFSDYRGIISNLKAKQQKKVMQDTAFLAEVTANAETVLRSFLAQAPQSAEFTVNFGKQPVQDEVTFTFLPAETDQQGTEPPVETQPTETVPTEPAFVHEDETAPIPTETEPIPAETVPPQTEAPAPQTEPEEAFPFFWNWGEWDTGLFF